MAGALFIITAVEAKHRKLENQQGEGEKKNHISGKDTGRILNDMVLELCLIVNSTAPSTREASDSSRTCTF